MECPECGARAAEPQQPCARCGAPLPQSASDLSRPPVTGPNPLRIRHVRSSLGYPLAAGFYPDPGGAGIREWTGTEWSPFLQGYPLGHGAVGPEPAPPTWSPLSPQLQQAQWDFAISGPSGARRLIIGWLIFALLSGFCTLLVAVADPDPQAPVVVGMFALFTVGCLIPALVETRNLPARRRIADAARQAHARAGMQDTPTPPEST
jgi:hypothetical protein